jgi:hypothetical protein
VAAEVQCTFFCYEAKQPNLKLKTWPKQLLGSLSLASTTSVSGYASPLAANIRLGWKWLAWTNALAYITALLIIASKSFVAHALGVTCYPVACIIKLLQSSFDDRHK